ncbi:hypothetical protein G7Y89_g3752 [Cudoniella acicularis]|uniref:Uncharacterized protein n=1 Tax=Cudoniella acicularis TaxID=354080 RepID=A0A8H4RQR9_9HELO|nr:hypothetical protein G7Y89_g3752 [Cudoniella acicularis]
MEYPNTTNLHRSISDNSIGSAKRFGAIESGSSSEYVLSSFTFDGHIYTSHLDVAAPVPRHGQEADIATDLLPSRPSWRTVIYDMQGPSTSLNLHLATQTLAMTWLSGNSQTGIAVSPMNISNDLDTDRPFIFTGPGTSRGSDVDVQSSAAAHPDSSLLFAFGTSQGILTMDKRDFSATWLSPKPSSETSATPYPKDVFAMEFLSDNPFILLSGGRNGILNITDLRRPRFESDADVILHPSCITHIKQLDMHRLIVAGLNSSLCQYDLRYRKSKMAQKSPLPKASRTSHNSTSTASILQYSEYQNSASIQIGFDVDTVSGIVAAAQEPDEYHPIVQLFSLHGGHTLSSPEVHRRFADIEVVKSLKFAEDFENRPKSLYVSYNGIHQFSWRQ